VKPPHFDYTAPLTVAEAVTALHDAAGTAKVLAGGQSLLQDLRWRRLAPALLVDITGIDELAGITVIGDVVRLGARVRHRDLEDPAAVPGPLGRLLARVAAHIAHPPVRSRGTFAGSLAWAHPASEWCAVAAGLRGRVELASVRGLREIPVSELLVRPGVTTCAPDELITAVVLPRPADAVRVAFREHRRTHASFAEVAVAAAVEMVDGAVARADIGLAGAAATARRAGAAEAVLLGTTASPADTRRAADAAARRDTAPVEEPDPYRRHLVDVLVRRTLDDLGLPEEP
jgi:aerobic carbon-monoxide dehydrogenase medium subunit